MAIDTTQLKSVLAGKNKTYNTASAIAMIVEIGASVGGGIAALKDAQKAAEFQDYLATLSEDDQNKLVQSINNAKSEEDTLAIIAAVIKNAQAKRIENLSGVIIRQEQLNRQKKVEKIILAAILGALVITLIYLKRKKP